MPAALLTRNTLVEIEGLATYMDAEAIAYGLGWKLDRLRRVAKAHGIKLKDAAEAAISAASADPELNALVETLTPQERSCFNIIRDAGDYISRARIADTMETYDQRVTDLVKFINRKFDGSQWRIVSHKTKGYRLGYRLVRQ